MYPGVPQLLGDYRQLVYAFQHHLCELVHGPGGYLRPGVLLPETLHLGGHTLRRRRAAVIWGVGELQGILPTDTGGAIKSRVIQDYLVVSIAQPAKRRQLHKLGGAVYADMQVLYPGFRKIGNHGVGVAGHIGHLGGYGAPAKAFVKPFRYAQTILEELTVHQLRMGGKGQTVPGYKAVLDGLCQHFGVAALL